MDLYASEHHQEPAGQYPKLLGVVRHALPRARLKSTSRAHTTEHRPTVIDREWLKWHSRHAGEEIISSAWSTGRDGEYATFMKQLF